METEKICQHCGKPLGPKAVHGLCPECMMKVGLGSGALADSSAGQPARPHGWLPPTPADLAPHFRQFEILELLGRGGMGAVYKARQKNLDRVVALKVLPPEAGADPAFAERFSREAQALARLNHPNIVTVHDFGQAGSFYYFVMEFIDGANLRHLLQTQRLSPREAMAIVPQICEALQYAHDQGVVHRDIKPENILVDKQGRVKIADFGLARLLGREPEVPRLTQAREIMGTPQYMAPEQLEKPLTVDHRADIFSLGVVFYEMLTGELPLGLFAPPSRKVQVDVRLDEVVLRALEKEPEMRYQQASQFKTEVETIASGNAQPEAPPVVRPPGSRAATAPSPHRRLVVYLALGLLLAGVLVTLLLVSMRRERALRAADNARLAAEKVTIQTAAAKHYTQQQTLDVQPDGTMQFKSTIAQQNTSGQPLQRIGFMNSDFVEVNKMTDDQGREIPFEVTHQGRTYRYRATLPEAVPAGEWMSYSTEGTMTGLVRPAAEAGVFEYRMQHTPGFGGITRRVELHRLPAGAEVLDKQPDDLEERSRDGRIELFIERLIPKGGSLLVAYRYRLGGGKPSSAAEDAAAKAVDIVSTCAEGDPRIAQALKLLKDLDDAEAVRALTGHLDSAVATQRRAAIYLLQTGGWRDIATAAPKLSELLSHEEVFTRGMAALALGQGKAESSLESLGEMAAKDADGYARRCAAYALGLLGDPRARPVLERALKDRDPSVAANARAALAMLDPASHPPPSNLITNATPVRAPTR